MSAPRWPLRRSATQSAVSSTSRSMWAAAFRGTSVCSRPRRSSRTWRAAPRYSCSRWTDGKYAEGRLAQLEQVAKKVEACLKVGGASLSDIIETRTYVADPDQLAKYADIRKQFRQRFTGPDDPQRGRAFRPRQP